MEEFNWENISDVSTGTPSSIWDITDQDNSHEFSILTDCADCHPHDATTNSEENTEEYQTVALDNENKVFYDYNLALDSAASRRHQQGDLRITTGISCSNNPFIMQEQAFHHKLPVEAAGNSVNYFSFSANSSDDQLSSSQIRLANDHKNSIISSKRSFYAASWGAISSESPEAVSQSFYHQLRKQKKLPPPEKTDCSNPNDLFLSGYQSDSLRKSGGFKLIAEDYSTNQKKPIWQNLEKSSKINFSTPQSPSLEPDTEAIAAMKEIMYREAVLRPVNLCPEAIDQKPKRKNVKTSSEPQTVAARQRRERISDKIRILQRLVPGGTKMDTATMLDEAANYLQFLKSQVNLFQSLGGLPNNTTDYQQELYQSPPSPIFK